MDIASLVPAQYRDLVLAACQMIAAASVLALALKRVAGVPSASDGPAKKALFVVLHAVDWLALNTATVSQSLVIAKQERAIAAKDEFIKTSIMPPPGAQQ